MTKTIALSRLSNPVKRKDLEGVIQFFQDRQVRVLVSPVLEQDVDGKTRASILNDWFSQDVDAVFDVSGGDLSIETLEYIDLDQYQKSHTLFFGYSDLTPILNVLGKIRKTILFQIRHQTRMEQCLEFLEHGSQDLFWDSKAYVGGNIRCFLKLAGSPYFPVLAGKDIFLESYSGDLYRIRSYIKQFEWMPGFSQIRSLTFGEFTMLKEDRKWLEDWARRQNFPVKLTEEVGHGRFSKALWIKG